MRALLDTNIVIHRENNKITNYSIGHLYRWIDKMNYSKILHPYTVEELNKYNDVETKEVINIKLQSYQVLKTIKKPDTNFLSKISMFKIKNNDVIDNCLLYEIYLGRVDLLITEDRKMLRKATILGIKDRVFSINQFISKMTNEHPELIDYKMLSVEKCYFGEIDLELSFFNSFRRDYKGFNAWFNKKCDEEAYICRDKDLILGFLYLKIENIDENYEDITPPFNKAKRLKVGTFKVESTGFRLGERFIKIVFDNALLNNVDEIYVTLFDEREELLALSQLLFRWGFVEYGIKETSNGNEKVLVKKMKSYNNKFSVKKNYPNLIYNHQKFILPIFPKYHTALLPDSKLNNENEVDFLNKAAHRYALQKVYISWAPERNINPGDYIIFYRPGEYNTIKKYTSVITTIGIVDEIIYNFSSKENFMQHCQNRSVFSKKELEGFWNKHNINLMIIKFIFVKSLGKKLTLGYLWNARIIEPPYGPRPFTRINGCQFETILKDSGTDIQFS